MGTDDLDTGPLRAFPHVFEPLRLRHRTLASRITFGAHTANMAEGGLPGDRNIGYYRERALGGAGMIVVEPVPIHRTGVLTRGNFRHDDDAVIRPSGASQTRAARRTRMSSSSTSCTTSASTATPTTRLPRTGRRPVCRPGTTPMAATR